MTPPETRYSRSGDVHIAYQIFGNGPLDLVLVFGLVSNIELQWEFPEVVDFYTRLASFSRVICFDKRGTGLSDRAGGIAPLEERMDDVRAVMDAAGSQRAALIGISEGGPMSILFAATYPERTLALVLYAGFAQAPGRAAGLSDEQIDARLALIQRSWGTEPRIPTLAPSRQSDEAFSRAWTRLERLSASPSAFVSLSRMNREIDVRHILPSIHVPTLVLHRSGDRIVRVELGRYIAENLPGAKYVELPGSDHLYFVDDSGASSTRLRNS
jgi:pimeloyl-ACP methyl ester carboxylesterase